MNLLDEGHLLDEVRDFWDSASCGEVYARGDDLRRQYQAQADVRYRLEPYLEPFADFAFAGEKDVLEIGVGMGADHQRLAMAGPRSLNGIDLTPRAIEHTRKRLDIFGLESNLQVGNAEHMPFDDESFDFIYSWGVIHHSPNTQNACNEIHRVLRKGGRAKVMIYHRRSVIGAMLWARYGLMKGKPFTSLDHIYHHYLESPGTKAFSVSEASAMFRNFRQTDTEVTLSFGELLEGEVGQRHDGTLLRLAKRFWPRRLIKAVAKPLDLGLMLMITATK
ncbi:MAG: class I SAM-dependent methyltransferase [Geminicoccaceae bacterium]